MDLKGTHLILEAVRRLREPSSVEVHLCGTAVESEYDRLLKELARDLPVRFHGRYEVADLDALDLDLAVFASIASESHSFTLDEALVLGLPVLVPDRGAFPERLGGAGLTFRADDASDLARRLQEILDAPELLETLRRSVQPEALLSMDAHVAMIEKLYADAVQVGRPDGDASTPHRALLDHARTQVRGREAAIVEIESRLAQAQRAADEARARLRQVEQSVADKDALLQEARRALDRLEQAHAGQVARSGGPRETPLVKLQEILRKLVGSG